MIKGAIVAVAVAATVLGADLRPAMASPSTSSDGQTASETSLVVAQAATPAPRARKAAPAKGTADAPAADATAAQGATAGWVSRCVSKSRDEPLDCALEQSVVVAKTGQLVALMRIQVPSGTRAPVMMVQLPLGLNIPAGLSLQIDDAPKAVFQIQTCDVQGCYVGSPVEQATVDALLSGKNLKVIFQNQSKQDVTVTMALTNFATGFNAIK